MVWKAVAAALFAVAAAQPAGAAQHAPSHEARELHDWVMKARDHHGRAFAIVDKKAARIYVYDGHGRLKGQSSALLGQAQGDDSAPGVGEHTQQGHVPFAERTTPAGRFVAEPGENLSGENVIWVDYDAAFAIHRLRPGASKADRERRLASADPEEHRASYGCVVVPVSFYTDVVERWLGKGRAVVYVMPENGSARELFADM
jgi:hypothetical protein